MSFLFKPLVKKYLKEFDFESAVFYAQMSNDLYQSIESLNLLTKCLIAKGDYQKTYILLKRTFFSDFFALKNFENSPRSVHTPKLTITLPKRNGWEGINKGERSLIYFFALTCLKLGKYSEGIEIYSKTKSEIEQNNDNFNGHDSKEFHILGALHQKCRDFEKSAILFEKSQRIDSFKWAAIEKLAKLKKQPDLSLDFYEERAEKQLVKISKKIKKSFEKSPNKKVKISETSILKKKTKFSKNDILKILEKMAKASFSLCCYKVDAALEYLKCLPCEITWVKRNLAVLYSEMGLFKLSAETFENLRYVAPHITDALDTYSTVLWQLGRKTELKTLSKFLLNSFGDKPQFLSVAANNFSLQGAHQKSISCLKRATNIDSEYAYGHCLMAFEYLAINALQNAENQFRTCLQIESENYKAFNGLGKASMMREEFKVAAMYFRKAAEINTGNHVLLSHLAEAEAKLGNKAAALSILNRIGNNKPLITYQKAKILFDMGDLDESLKLLKHLTTTGDDEVQVMALMGKIYKLKRQNENALEVFSSAVSAAGNSIDDSIEMEIDQIVQNNVFEER